MQKNGPVIRLLGNNGKCVVCEGGCLMCVGSRHRAKSRDAQFRLIYAGGGKVALRVRSLGCFVSAGQDRMACQCSAIGESEMFEWVPLGGSQCALKSGEFYATSMNGAQPMATCVTHLKAWERFSVEFVAPIGDRITLSCHGAGFLCSMNGTSPVHCCAVRAQAWELFYVENAGDSWLALKGSNSKYLSSEDGKEPMRCNRSKRHNFEKFRFIHVSVSSIRILASNNKFVSLQNGYLYSNSPNGSIFDLNILD